MSSDHSTDTGPNHSSGLLKLSAVLIVLAVVGVLVWIRPQWYQNYAPAQPIPFSHKLHAGQYNIPCQYCHGAAEYTAHAEVPGVDWCMNCHSVVKTDSPYIQQIKSAYDTKKPIQWVKVHVLPDFVHFNHKRHIAAGVQCETCHGNVKEMDRVYQWAPLTMGWCIDCHRNDNYLTDYRKKFSNDTKALKGEGEKPFWFKALSHPDPHNADVSCSTCHY